MDGIALMAQAMHAARARLDLSASNLANVSSASFHRRVARVTLRGGELRFSSAADDAPGPLERTGRPFDLATTGRGGFFVRGTGGAALERSSSLNLDSNGRLVDARGRALLGMHGVVRATPESTIDGRGIVRDGKGRATDRLRSEPGTSLASGFLERSNVDAIAEMVDLLGAQRAFETAEKTLSAIDETRAKSVNDLARIAA